MSGYGFAKGHGTENDFVVLPDPDGDVHGELGADRVRALCDRHAGIGADGVLRVIRTSAIAPALAGQAEWFMDYRNADGSLAQMCGNGVRVFARYLIENGLAAAGEPIPVATRDGVKTVEVVGDRLRVDMGTPVVLGESKVGVGDLAWTARHVDMGNPHAVAFVDDLAQAGSLLEQPSYDAEEYPEGVNIEFAVRRGPARLAMRVHERGSGETRSCGTGACAVMVAAAEVDKAARETAYTIEVPGGILEIVWTAHDRVLMTGPAVLVASGVTEL